MQLEWARQIPGRVLILAPLAVAPQTVREGQKLGIDVSYSRKPCDARITITNYEMLERFSTEEHTGVVLDESSILKSYDGKFRTAVIERFAATPFRLACTATPAPNDFMELGNHAEFLGSLTRTEMLSTFFVHDGGDTSKWRLKGHAESDFWRWVCSWAVMLRKPSDLGYADDGFILPPIEFHSERVDANVVPTDTLFACEAQTLMERRQVRAASTDDRCKRVAEIVATKPDEQWLIWCDLNRESETVAKLIPGAVEVTGSDSEEWKEQSMLAFADGEIRVMVSKPSIAGFGMNFQSCANVVFVGLSDSYEAFYQAVRRCWRFGQKNTVHCYVVTSTLEGAVVENIQRKERDAARMAKEMVNHMHELNEREIHGTVRKSEPYIRRTDAGRDWTMHLGDSVEVVAKFPDDSIHYSIFSPPFASLYTYSASERDMGNCRTHAEFYAHFRFLARELYRVMKPGRLLSFHAMDLPRSKERDGVIGLFDFPAKVRDIMEDVGFIYHSRVCIWKDPVTAMQRTKAIGLLHKQLKKDSCLSRQGIADYLITVRKPGVNDEPVTHTNETFPVQVWQRYASPVWMDINPNDTLQRESAREEKDERHICPLQLEVIARALRLWTNEGDTVLSPFAGIGSEGHEAIRAGRNFIGIELKESYFIQACANLRAAEQQTKPLFNAPSQSQEAACAD
jgi:DNA modification methylase